MTSRLQRALRHVFLCAIALTTISTAPAAAQTAESPVGVTAFGGVAWAPGPHPASGIAVGVKPRDRTPLGLEFEYARSRRDPASGVPGIVTVAGNFVIQPALKWSRVRVYATLGVGGYVLLRDHGSSEANDARNFGGGVKMTIAGPFKLRMDYRRFLLARIGGEYHSNEHRLYLGIVAGF
jgi:hypothetical protein